MIKMRCRDCKLYQCVCDEIGLKKEEKMEVSVEKRLQPITQELLRTLNAYERSQAIKKHHEWLRDVRKKERRFAYNELQKIYMTTHPEAREKAKRAYYLKNPEYAERRNLQRRKWWAKLSPEEKAKCYEKKCEWRKKNKERLNLLSRRNYLLKKQLNSSSQSPSSGEHASSD